MQNNLSELIDLIDNKVKIESIISNYIHLEKKGNNYVGLCPFHSDSNPSLIVSPNKKIFKCFSCGAGGGIIKFVQNYENLSFLDSIKKISTLAGIDWKYYINEKKVFNDPEKELLKKINLEASNFFKFNLENKLNEIKNNKVKEYLKKRKIDTKIITKFKIGYTEGNNSLFNFLLKKGFKEEEIIKSKLVRISEKKIYDFFKERIIFPIFNINNEIIAFSGRILEKQTNYAKYLNSEETKIFNKQQTLYNINNAENKIRLKRKAIIVEGFMDVIAFDKLEYENVIATMGTNFSKYHLDYLKNLTNEINLCFDVDEPGINTTLNVGKKLLIEDFSLKVIQIKKGKDFDEFINLETKENIKKEIENPLDFVYFLIKKTLTKENLNEKDISNILEIIKLEKDGIKRENYLNFIKQQTTSDYIQTFIEKNKKNVLTSKFINTKKNVNIKNNNYFKIEKILDKIREQEIFVFALILEKKSFLKENNIFFTKKITWLYNKIIDILKNNNENMDFNILKENFTEQELLLFEEISSIQNNLKINKNEEYIKEELNNRKDKINFLIKEYSNLKLREQIRIADDFNYDDLKWLTSKVNK